MPTTLLSLRLGLPAVAIDIEMVTEVGYVTEHSELRVNSVMLGQGIKEVELFATIEVCTRDCTNPSDKEYMHHMVTGLYMPPQAPGFEPIEPVPALYHWNRIGLSSARSLVALPPALIHPPSNYRFRTVCRLLLCLIR